MARVDKRLETSKITFKNRIIMPPMYTGKASEEGSVTEELLQYYDERTENGNLAAVIVEHSYISKQGKAGPRQISIATDDAIAGLKKLSEVIHKNGSLAVIQLNHAGGATRKEITGENVISPSKVEFTTFSKNLGGDKIMDKADIQKITEEFVQAAIRAKKSGFDGIEIHAAHGYLLNQFYSPITNKRTDAYGGNVKNRVRVHTEIIKKVREAVGEEYPIFLRLGAIDYQENGNTIEDALEAAKLMELAGVDVLDISGGLTGFVVKGRENQPGYFADASKPITKALSIPVILTGGFKTLGQIEESLKKEEASLIGVGRAIYTDPQWAEKVFATQHL